MRVHLYYGPALATYAFGHGHPFGPDRLDAFWAEAQRQGLDRQAHVCAPEFCGEADLLRFHSADYVEYVRDRSRDGTGYLDFGDTPAFKGMYEAACAVAGSGLAALKRILAESRGRAFVPIAGLHHARRDAAAGFCVINDIGILIETLRRVYGLRRIAYVDIDAHHGDGVFYAFEDDPDLYIADTHEDGRFLFPGTGAADETGTGAAVGTKLNIPLLPGADDRAFFHEWPRIEEHVRAAQPELILLQAGADSIRGDPLTHLAFSPEVHGHAAARLAQLADEYCDGRLLALGGGGYDRRNLALAWSAVVRGLLAT